MATQAISRIKDVFEVEIPLQLLFESPTVASMAASLEVAMKSDLGLRAPPIARIAREETLPLSFAQQRLWFISHLEPLSTAYNMPFVLRFGGRLDLDALTASLNEVVRRHESLRTSFPLVDEQPVQLIAEVSHFSLPIIELHELENEERERAVRRQVTAEAQAPFSLATGPLFRVKLLRLGAEEHVLLATMHHIIADGWSLGC